MVIAGNGARPRAAWRLLAVGRLLEDGKPAPFAMRSSAGAGTGSVAGARRQCPVERYKAFRGGACSAGDHGGGTHPQAVEIAQTGGSDCSRAGVGVIFKPALPLGRTARRFSLARSRRRAEPCRPADRAYQAASDPPEHHAFAPIPVRPGVLAVGRRALSTADLPAGRGKGAASRVRGRGYRTRRQSLARRCRAAPKW